MDRLHSLAWCQPFGTLMLHGKIETRRYPTKVRGPVLIYTTKKSYDFHVAHSICGAHQYARLHNTVFMDPSHLVGGFAIAVGNLVDCRPMQITDEDRCFVRYTPGLYCWIFEDVKRIEPFKYEVKLPHSDKMVSAGGQGWGWVPEELMSKIKYI